MWLRCFNGWLNSDNIESLYVSHEASGKYFLNAKMRGGDVKRVSHSLPTEKEKKLGLEGKGEEVRISVERRRLDMMKLMKGVVALISKKEIKELKDEVAELADEIFGDKKGKSIERKAKKGE